jgi:3-oxoacyl-[acyl-carrier-protein] synthase II
VSRACIIAQGAVSALGLGRAATTAGQPGEPACCAIAHDAALAQGGLGKPNAARAPVELGGPALGDRDRKSVV